MINLIIQGGLGNQMFQYAYGEKLRSLGHNVKYNLNFFLDTGNYTKREPSILKFNIPNMNFDYNPIKTFYHKLRNQFAHHLKLDFKVKFVAKNLNLNKDKIYVLDDYYQSEKYFIDIREIILKQFQLKEEYKSDLYRELERQITVDENNIILHARRGDIINNPGVFNVLTSQYYQDALTLMREKFPNAMLYVYSDDVEWVKGIINDNNMIVISGRGLTDYEELSLMSLGNNFIIANSTFSWWGAWLSQYDKKVVIAPKQWFRSQVYKDANNDIAGEGWLRV